MCECPCGDTSPHIAFPNGIEGGKLAIQLYPGCQNCDNPPGIEIYNFNAEDAATWCIFSADGRMNMGPSASDGIPAFIGLPTGKDLMEAFRSAESEPLEDVQTEFFVETDGETEPLSEWMDRHAIDLMDRVNDIWIARMRTQFREMGGNI